MNDSRCTVKPTHSTVVKGYEEADQPLQVDHFPPLLKFSSNQFALVLEGGREIYEMF
jgi:hypothetical protein